MKNEQKTALKVGVVLGVLILLVVAFASGVFSGNKLSQLPSGNSQSSTSTSTSQYANTVGTFWIYQNTYDALNTNAAASDSEFVFYAYRGSSYVPLGGNLDSYTQVETTAADHGVVYAVASAASDYIFDAAKTAQANSAITSINFIDITGTGNPEFVCTVSLANVPTPASGYPSLSLIGFFYDQAVGDVSLNSPSAVSLSSFPTTSYIQWSLTDNVANEALAYYKVQVKMNCTSTGDMKVTSMQIPGVGNVAGSALHYWYDSSYQYFEYTVGTGNLNDCGFMTWTSNEPAIQYCTTSIQTGAIPGSAIAVTYTIFALDYTGSTVTITNTVNVVNDS